MKSGQADDLSRRAFLLKLSGLMAASYGLQLGEKNALAKGITAGHTSASAGTASGKAAPSTIGTSGPIKGPGYMISPWSGDDFTLGHRMRSGDGPRLPKHADSKVDFVIVGGGNAGLTSAYKLRNHNFILLEQYDDLGGTSRGYSENGLYYSIGAAFYSQEEGPVADLVHDFGLKPAVLAPDKNNFYFESKWVNGVEGPDSNLLYRNFKRLKNDIAPVIKELNFEDPKLPLSNPSLLKLDKINFASMLEGYDAPFCDFVDRILMSSACADSKLTNALAGSILANDFFDKSFVLPGGNPCLTRAIASHVGGKGGHIDERLKTGCFVWSVEIKDDGASVVYSDKAGHMHRVDCKHVIMATLPMVTGRILSGVKNEAKGSLFWFRYGSYLVANVICKKRVFKGSYDNFLRPPFDFSDIVIAETPYLKNKNYKETMGSVLSVYNPWQPGTMGRSILQEGDRAKLAADLVKTMGQFIPDLDNNISKIVMTRWGHAINICQLRYYERISKINGTFGDSYTLSHSSLQGIQCIESAVKAGIFAADRALKIKTKIGAT